MAGIDDRSIYEADRLDEFLSDVVHSQSAARASAGLDPALAETVRATVSLAVAPPPSAGFARHLRAELMRPGRRYRSGPRTGGTSCHPPAPAPAPSLVPRAPIPRRTTALGAGSIRDRTPPDRHRRRDLDILPSRPEGRPYRRHGDTHQLNPGLGRRPSAATYRGGATRTGVNPGPGLANPPVELWTSSPNTTHTDPVVADGVVYTITGNGDLLAVDARTGQGLWRRDTDVVGDAIVPPLVAGGVLYAGLPDGNFYALDAANGAVRWQYPAGGLSCGSPALVNGVVYGAEGCDMPGIPGGAVFALDAATGRELWRVTIDDGRITTPAVAEGMVFVGAGGPTVSHGYPTHIRAFDAATGQERWIVEVGGIESSPAFANGTLYVASARGLWALAPADGSVRWHAQVGRDDAAVSAPPAVAGGLVFAASNDGYLYAFDAGTGEPRWEFDSWRLLPP